MLETISSEYCSKYSDRTCFNSSVEGSVVLSGVPGYAMMTHSANVQVPLYSSAIGNSATALNVELTSGWQIME